MNVPVVRVTNLILHYGKVLALDNINLEIPSGCMVGLIGPDGVGKSSLLSLIAGVRAVQKGQVEVLGGDIANAKHRNTVCPDIAYMPQGLGKNLYPTLSVEENLQFFGQLFGHDAKERRKRIDELAIATNLYPFLARPAGKLSGGMKQKLGLCCSLIHDPDLLILDEPTTGVDPLSRNQFWELITNIRKTRPEMSVLVATAYMDEAQRFDWLIAMDDGKVLATGAPQDIYQRTQTTNLEAAFIALLPAEKTHGHKALIVPPLADTKEIAIEAHDLTMRFGNFTAVDHVSFRIKRGEIFGFLGSNGCGKSTTMKMLTGLLPATAGEAWLFGNKVNSKDIATRRRVGYMSQGFSLYSELSVQQNLILHAQLFNVPKLEIALRVAQIAARFKLNDLLDAMPDQLPLGIRQRLSLAVAMVHKPDMLILDEPTSGVDPVARDDFWQSMIDLARHDKITIFISTHFMNEAERCDRISLMHNGHVLISEQPAELVRLRGTATLEEAFISYLQEAQNQQSISSDNPVLSSDTCSVLSSRGEVSEIQEDINMDAKLASPQGDSPNNKHLSKYFSISRLLSYTAREALELQRDPIRSALALFGSLMLMLVMGFGINMDVENLSFAVLDRDQTELSNNYILNLAGSRYFIEHAPITDYKALDYRMRAGEISLAIEIPSGFARDVQRGKVAQIGAWIDGAMPQRAETVQGYVKAMHNGWLIDLAKYKLGHRLGIGAANVETRFRYNPDVKSLPAMVPAVIPLLLLMFPAMLTALSVVREKELGSIINLYATPVTRMEFLLGKQLPYIALGMLNFFLMVLLAIFVFAVPVKGSFLTLVLATFIFIVFATGFGLFVSIFTRSQIAALFMTMITTMVPVMQFSGLINPTSALEGVGRFIGNIYPATYFLIISRGVFTKGLSFGDLYMLFIPILIAVPVIIGLSIALLQKQER